MFSVHFCNQCVRAHVCRCNDFCFSCQKRLKYTLDIWDKESIGLVNVLDDISMTLTQGHGCGLDKQKFAYLQDKVRTTQPIITNLGSYIPQVMLITLFDCKEFCCKLLLPNFLLKFRMCFSRSNTILNISQEWLIRLMWNEKEVRLDTGSTVWLRPLTSSMTLTFDFFKVKSRNRCILGIVIWLLWNKMKAN